MSALGLGDHLGVPQPVEPWKRVLYPLNRLDLTIADALTSPTDHDYEGYQKRLFDHYIEIQLWLDDPVAMHLSR